MKTKIRRVSKRTLAVFLGIMILFSSIGIGSLITANATDFCDVYIASDTTATIKVACYGGSCDGNWYTAKSVSGATFGDSTRNVYKVSLPTDATSSCVIKYNNDGNKIIINNGTSPYDYRNKIYCDWVPGWKDYKNVTKNVTGENGLTGYIWDNNQSTNNMTLGNDGVYYKTFSNVSCNADQTFQFNVIDQGSWDWKCKNINTSACSGCTVSWNDNNSKNMKMSITDAGYYSITVKYSTFSDKLWVLASRIQRTVTIGSVTNGSITASSASVYPGATVTLTLSPNTGYSPVAPTVTGNTTSTSVSLTEVSSTSYTFEMPNENVTVTAVFPVSETQYPVTITNDGHGTTSNSSINAGRTTAIPLGTATPNYGYKFKNWTASGGGIRITKPTSATGATATATGSGGTITANFEPIESLNLYIAGRIQVRPSAGSSSWTNSYDSGEWSDTGDDNIKFEYDSTAQKYKVQTYASIAQLATKHSSKDPWFFVYDKSNTYYWYYEQSTAKGLEYSDRGTEYQLTKYTSKSSTYDCKLKFAGNTNETPVTIWFDATTQKISFTVPTFHDISFTNKPTGGTVTVTVNSTEYSSNQRLEHGTSYTVKFKPDTGYDLNSTVTIGENTVQKSSLSGDASSGYTYSGTLTADTTITAAFSKINYTITYPSSPSGYTIGGSKPPTAQYGNNVSFTITPDSNFRIDSVTYTANGVTNTITPSGTTYSFTMPAGKVTITVTSIAQKTLTVIKSVGSEGITKVEYKVGSAAYTTYSTPVVVDTGSAITLRVTYATGWEYKYHSFTGSSGTKTNNTTFNISSMDQNTTFDIQAKKQLYTISIASGVTGLASGATIKDANNNTITQTTIGEKFYISVSSAANYMYSSVSATGSPTLGTVTTNYDDTVGTSSAVIEYKMGSNNVVVTPSFIRIRKIQLPSLDDHVTTTIHYRKMSNDTDNTLTEGNSIWARATTAPQIYVNPVSGYKMDITIKDGTTTLTTLQDVTHKDSSITNYTYTNFSSSTSTAVINIEANEDLSTGYYILGDFNSWDGTQYEFKKSSGASDSNISYATINFNASDAINYSSTGTGFKLKSGSTWYTNSSLTLTTDSTNKAINDTTGGENNNVTLKTTVAGNYAFTLDTTSGRSLSVTYPDQNISYSDDSNVTYHTDYHPSTSKYSRSVTVKVKAKPNYKVNGITVANQTANYNSFQPTAATFVRPIVQYSDPSNTEYYYEFTFTMGKDHVNVTFNTSQISLAVTPNISSSGFSTKIYNDAGTEEITTISTGQFYKIVCVAADNTYTIGSSSFVYTYKPENILSSATNTYTFRCRANAYDLSASINYLAAKPDIYVNNVLNPAAEAQEITLFAGKPNTLSDINVTKVANNNNSWVKYALFDTKAHAEATDSPGTASTVLSGRCAYSQNGTIEAPKQQGPYYMCVYAYNQPADLSAGTYSNKIIVKVNVTYQRTTTNFYVDVHSFTITNTAQTDNMVEIYDGDGSVPGSNPNIYPDAQGDDLRAYFSLASHSTIYQATDLEIPDNNVDLYAKVTINGVDTWVELSSDKIANNSHTLDVWLEAAATERASSTTFNNNTVSNKPASGTKRIYLKKPSNWSHNNNTWNNIYIYYWSDSGSISHPNWTQSDKMYNLGYIDKGGNQKNDYYYCFDIPEGADYVIFKENNNQNTSEQTDNISLSSGSNFYELTTAPSAKALTKVAQPKFTGYIDNIRMNVDNTLSIKPKGVTDDMKVTYTVGGTNPGAISVSQDGILTSHTSGVAQATATVTIKVEGSIREKEGFTYYGQTTNDYTRDYYEQTINVTVIDDTLISGVQLMSYSTASTTVNIVNLDEGSSNIPANIVGADTKLSIKGKTYKTTSVTANNVTNYTYCGIVTFDGVNNTVTFKYAKPDDTNSYTSSNLVFEAKVNTEVVGTGNDGERYGFEKWQKNGDDLSTSTYKDDSYILIDGNPYSKCFKSYPYTDFYITYKYYDYKVERANGEKITYYDTSYVNEDPSNPEFNNTHVERSYTKKYEVRIKRTEIAAKTDEEKLALMSEAASLKLVNVKSNYYTYTYSVACIDTKSFKNKADTNHGMEFTVVLTPTVRTYNVFLNGTTEITGKHYGDMIECNNTTFPSQVDGTTIYKWQTRKTEGDSVNLVTVATGKSYKFRLSGNTYLTTESLSGDTNLTTEGNASVVTHTGYEYGSTGDEALGTLQELIYQNFYIADFYNNGAMAEYTVQVPKYDDYGDETGEINVTKKRDLSFIGGGVLYYSVDSNNGNVNNKVLDNRYVTTDNKTVLYDANDQNYPILEKIRQLIEAQDSSKEKAYAIPSGYVANTHEKGQTVSSGTGFFYRFLPYMQYNATSGKNDIKNNDAFRYSSALGAYQYIFTQGIVNKESTKNMRVYSYYIYGYNDYENNDGEMVYKYVISQNYVDAATYIPNSSIYS